MKLLESGRVAKPDSVLSAIESSDLELQQYLRTETQDVQAAVLLMRFHYARIAVTSSVAFFTGALETADQPEPFLGIVERALRADTSNAELHYWKGRLYALPEFTKDEVPSRIPRLNEAILETRRAVAIDPKETMYRESLGFLLLQSGDEAAARSMYKNLSTKHPVYLLLHDWERMPAIEGTVAQKNPMQFAASQSSPLAYAALAMSRLYLFGGTAEEFEKRCRRHWPSFHLLLDPDRARHPEGARRYAQHLRWKGDVLEPDAVQSEVSGGQQPGIGRGGIWVEVVESRALATDPPDQHPGIKPGEIYCSVEFNDKRSPNPDSNK